jgi:prepilin-type N-terminal cleavage/methylation domain-containing protein
MKRRHAAPGFTLVELLMVIAIIAVLIGLLAAGIIGFLSKGPEIQTVNDIRQMEISLQNFKNHYRCWPPSRIKLCATRAEYIAGVPIDDDSLRYIGQIWPRIDFNTPSAWNGSAPPPAGGVILEADLCLVFCLGGPGGTSGFSTNPTNPASPAGDRVAAFDTVETARLADGLGGRTAYGFPS